MEPVVIAAATGVAVVLFVVVLYNRLVRARVRVDEAWALSQPFATSSS